jgi:isoleucyl-tRNA synthetase
MVSIVKAEEEVLKFWNDDNSFVKSNQNSKSKFIFFEGPPFATGLPHYGHVLAGLIKDTVCRWACQNGNSVQRIATWDSHGLPIEYEIEKAHGIKTKQDILSLGVPAYNSACKSIVLRYSDQWKDIIGRLGRWIDWDSNIKTMDRVYMEKVWSIFGSIYSQGLIFEDFKVMPYSNACTTPLSNFEASSNYQTVNDQTVVVKFRSKTSNINFLVWTTTPWTLPANQALCVNTIKNFIFLVKS